MKNLNYLTLLIGLLLIIIILGIFIEVFKKERSSAPETDPFCGVVDNYSMHYLSANDSINLQIGKMKFRELCASCHNKTMVGDLTGPALLGSIKRFEYDTLKFANYIRNPGKYLLTQNDNRINLLHKKYGGVIKPACKNLTLNEVKSIIAYIEKY